MTIWPFKEISVETTCCTKWGQTIYEVALSFHTRIMYQNMIMKLANIPSKIWNVPEEIGLLSKESN